MMYDRCKVAWCSMMKEGSNVGEICEEDAVRKLWFIGSGVVDLVICVCSAVFLSVLFRFGLVEQVSSPRPSRTNRLHA